MALAEITAKEFIHKLIFNYKINQKKTYFSNMPQVQEFQGKDISIENPGFEKVKISTIKNNEFKKNHLSMIKLTKDDIEKLIIMSTT